MSCGNHRNGSCLDQTAQFYDLSLFAVRGVLFCRHRKVIKCITQKTAYATALKSRTALLVARSDLYRLAPEVTVCLLCTACNSHTKSECTEYRQVSVFLALTVRISNANTLCLLMLSQRGDAEHCKPEPKLSEADRGQPSRTALQL